ncbi:hypothetical protein THAOC_37791 [Thalassiosira oceanica]|uniref:Uncharacterized protein n=1 Tax=Thalassiosira oceanica TaxID=159749 RepID=K0QZL9_THAOC|nr:hypothetical protein THAOC_37791 [Thalassiosira oceanica]|mmetsp:Transcript_32281/g.73199  ORF Transcript_32281/g.73199 Transcript_32281/m.73199 type:complete len:1513 (-) Transcript_32281:44-4582(-)|eukprot:EJK43724.1 hypothetical protein THAOC_37791 [Thalassiosira oceanica]
MGLFNKLIPGSSNSGNSQKQRDWIPTAIEFTTSEVDSNSQQSGSLSGFGNGLGSHDMLGHGMNSRSVGQQPPASSGFRTQSSEMVGRGVNTRAMHQQDQGLPPQQSIQNQHRPNPFDDSDDNAKQQRPNPFDDSDDNLNSDGRGEPNSKPTSNPFDLDYGSDDDENDLPPQQQPSRPQTQRNNTNPFMVDSPTPQNRNQSQVHNQQQQQQQHQQQYNGPPAESGGFKNFDDSMKAMEEKLSTIDDSKFMDFVDDNSSNTPLSGIEEGSEQNGSDMGGKKTKKKGLKRFFGSKRSKSSNVGNQSRGVDQQRRIHRPAVDSDSGSDEDESYISGEFDEEFDNEDGFRSPHPSHRNMTSNPTTQHSSFPSVGANGNNIADAPIGVPNARGGAMTSRQLEDELYLYKLETLNLTDACRELAEQLDEVESKLESVQAQATFRIHALEAELQDGHVGMKSLVKMTSTEMDGRLEALRALGKTATIQAAKLKERDSELILLDQRLRKTRRDIKSLKRENEKVKNEKKYLKNRLMELDEIKVGLEKDLQTLAMENTSSAMNAEEREKFENIKKKLNDTLEQVGYMKSQLEMKDNELEELRISVGKRDAEVENLRNDLESKELDIGRVENQLEKVRKELLEAASAAKTAEDARVESEQRATETRTELGETVALLDEVTAKLALLESQEAELKRQLDEAKSKAVDDSDEEDKAARISELQDQINVLQSEKDAAISAVDSAQETCAVAVTEKQLEIDTLNRDVEVHREQMELAQTMLEEKEMLVNELRDQLTELVKDEELRIAAMKEDLATKTREVSNVTAELDERAKDVHSLEEKLEKTRKEFMEFRAEAEQRIADGKSITSYDDDDTVMSSVGEMQSTMAVSSATHTAYMTELAEKETQIERLERELGTNKRSLGAMRIEMEEKDRTAERLKTELERLKSEKGERVEELETQLEERQKLVDSLRKEAEDEKESMAEMSQKLRSTHASLDKLREAVELAEQSKQEAELTLKSSKDAEQAAKHEHEKLKSQIDLLQKAKERVDIELTSAREEADKEKKSSTQAAATLAATNAARQAENEMKIEKMEKEIDFKKREIDAIKSELKEKTDTSKRLQSELSDAKEDLIRYKESVEIEHEKKTNEEQEKVELEAMQRVADRDYFDEDDAMSKSSGLTQSTTDFNKSSRGGLFGLFGRSTQDVDPEGENVDWQAVARQKDSRIDQLEKTLAENALSISNLKSELGQASNKFKEDESQRRLLIQRLENENQAYSIKVEVLESEFDEIRKRKEAVSIAKGKSSNSSFCDDGSVASSVHSTATGHSESTGTVGSSVGSTASSRMTGVSSITGASRLTPLERDNRKLKKQKKVYETRIASLQTQLSEIQQIVPELMSKSKAQIQKLETVIQTQREEAAEKEKKLEDEVLHLREQNAELQAATRSRLQSSNVEQQEEIDQLRMRLEAREATIKKLEMIGASGKGFRRKGKMLRKKKSRKASEPTNGDEVSVLSGGSYGQSVASYSVMGDSVFN